MTTPIGFLLTLCRYLTMTKVSPEVVRDILLSPDSPKATAQRHNISRHTVEQIWFGVGHKKVFPEIPRRNSVVKHSCERCVMWLKGKCSLDFPEPEQNLFFARECNIFTKTN
jgi:hypothetical protein